MQNHFDFLPRFLNCETDIFHDPSSFVQHLLANQCDYYHRIVLRMVQNSYSSLISKIKMSSEHLNSTSDQMSFGSIHRGIVSLPSYVKSTSEYDTFSFQKNDKRIILCRTNILESNHNKEYLAYFSESSFQKTLKKLILCGEYNKTKKRSTPMY